MRTAVKAKKWPPLEIPLDIAASVLGLIEREIEPRAYLARIWPPIALIGTTDGGDEILCVELDEQSTKAKRRRAAGAIRKAIGGMNALFVLSVYDEDVFFDIPTQADAEFLLERFGEVADPFPMRVLIFILETHQACWRGVSVEHPKKNDQNRRSFDPVRFKHGPLPRQLLTSFPKKSPC